MKNKVLFAVAILTAMLFTACEGNDPTQEGNDPTQIVENNQEPGMYVGVTGFSDDVQYFESSNDRYEVLTSSNVSYYNSFINGLEMGDATVLYYAVDNNLNYLQKCKFPDDLSSVNIITFTDGLNQGSRALDKKDGNHDYAANDESYVNEIHHKIETMTVQGLSINAYAIGIRGKDVSGDAVSVFKNNLLKLSSTSENAMEVSNMDEVSVRFKEIAASLYKRTESTNLTITIPMPSDNEIERFTFDNISDATASQCYIEGLYVNGALTDIKYVGCMSNSGNVVQEQEAGGVKIKFVFENFTDDKGQSVSTKYMQQWHMSPGQSTWTRNSEFHPDESISIEEERKTAVVMLILDCSSSLGSDFTKVKKAANDFIKTLAGEAVDNPGTDPGTDPGTETAYYIKHPWGSGADSSWSWKKMTKINDGNYEYSGLWGGVGANINTTASDNGAQWFDASSISGASSLSVGDGVKFTYNSSTNKLSATKTSSGGSSNKTQVRFRKENAYEYVLSMSIEKVNGGEWESTEAEHEFGTASGTSNYYDISSGVLYPMFYYDNGSESGWYYALDSESYNFVAGKKYTYTCSDDGTYLTFSIQLDGNAGAPAKVIASRRIQKTKIHNLPKVRK